MRTVSIATPRPTRSLTRRPAGWRGRGLAGPFGAPLFLSLAAVALFFLPDTAIALEYDRGAILAGEAWRLVTGHLVHRSLEHLFWDALAFALLGGLCVRRWAPGTWLALALATIAIPLVLLVFVPEMATYRGLSGLDSTLFVLAALLLAGEARRTGRRRELAVPAAALALFVVKVSWETATGSAWFAPPSAPGEVVVPLAHLVGAGAAILPLAVAAVLSRRKTGSGRRSSSAACPDSRSA